MDALARRCRVCDTPLAGAVAALLRLTGVRRSARNPNVCTRCNAHLEDGRLVEVSVLFADLCSFTELTHRLGPERTHEVVDRFLRAASHAVVDHDGFVDKYIGDAVMAFFNVPIRRADHGGAAVATAAAVLEELPRLSAELGVPLEARVGVASGHARMGRLGSSDARDFTALGDVVNRAARLEAQARPGEVVVDAAAFGDVAARYPDAPREELRLKGFDEAVPSYRIAAAGSAPAPAPVAAGDPPPRRRLVGLGAVIFALLGAPCAVTSLVGPLAVAVGLASAGSAAAGAAGPHFGLDSAPLRLPFLGLAALGIAATLYTLWHARRLRRRARAEGRDLGTTRLERRRTWWALGSAIAALLVVGLELYAHEFIEHQPWP